MVDGLARIFIGSDYSTNCDPEHSSISASEPCPDANADDGHAHRGTKCNSIGLPLTDADSLPYRRAIGSAFCNPIVHAYRRPVRSTFHDTFKRSLDSTISLPDFPPNLHPPFCADSGAHDAYYETNRRSLAVLPVPGRPGLERQPQCLAVRVQKR